MSRSRAFAVPALLLTGVALLVGLFFLLFEKRTEVRDSGFQGEARLNPYLGAQRLIAGMGAEVRSLERMEALAEPLPDDGLLIFPVHRSALTDERAVELLDWVSRGGHLVVVAYSFWDDAERTPDPILDPLGIEQYTWTSDVPEDDATETEPEFETPEPEIAELWFPDRADPLRAEFDPSWFLIGDPDAAPQVLAMGDRYGTHWLTVRHGSGYVTALTDDFFMRNDAIGDHDHAELVWRMTQMFERSGEVWIVWRARYASVFELLREHAWMVVLALCAWLGSWLWSASRRFGPPVPDDPIERRSLMEHIEACGRFHLERGNPVELLASIREAVLRRMRERHPAWLALGPAAQAERIAERTGLHVDAVARALAYSKQIDRNVFARRVATLERIRKAL